MAALRFACALAASLAGVALGRLLGEHAGIGAIPWRPEGIGAAIGGTAAWTVQQYWRRRRS